MAQTLNKATPIHPGSTQVYDGCRVSIGASTAWPIHVSEHMPKERYGRSS